MNPDVSVALGPLRLRTPLVGASGTVGSVWEFSGVADMTAYGALVAKSVSGDPWTGRPAPRLAPAGVGMLNGIGIQNPGIEAWVSDIAPKLAAIDAAVWGSAVGHTAGEYARVAAALSTTACTAVEVNLSCPNLADGRMFALDPVGAGDVVAAVREATDLPVGAKLSPNAEDVVAVAEASVEAGADWLTLTNTAWGAGVDLERRAPLLSGGVGGYSGPPLKALAMRCVLEVTKALPGVPVLGCGGVARGEDVIEYLMAGASAVSVGTAHFADPAAGSRILTEAVAWCREHGVDRVEDLVGAMESW